MEPSQKAYEMIKKFEGLRLMPYKAHPKEKYYTIGYGHYGEDVKGNKSISPAKAESILEEDVAAFSGKLAEELPNLSQNQYDALVSLVYNIGWYQFRYSTTFNRLKQINSKYTPLACARCIILWVRASGQVLVGLQKRRVIEANHFLGYEHFRLLEGGITETF